MRSFFVAFFEILEKENNFSEKMKFGRKKLVIVVFCVKISDLQPILALTVVIGKMLSRGGGQPREGKIFDLHPPGHEFVSNGKTRFVRLVKFNTDV